MCSRATELAQDAQAVFPGQSEVEDEQVEGLGLGHGQRVHPVLGDGGGEPIGV